MPHVSLATPHIDAWVDSLLATAPPLSPSQRDRIAAAFGADTAPVAAASAA